MKIERSENRFGLLGELLELKAKIVNNVRNAATTIHNLKEAAEGGTLHEIPQADLVALFAGVLENLNAVSD